MPPKTRKNPGNHGFLHIELLYEAAALRATPPTLTIFTGDPRRARGKTVPPHSRPLSSEGRGEKWSVVQRLLTSWMIVPGLDEFLADQAVVLVEP
jgi:hypothetical protein